jgi:hypothetical protein
MDSMDKWIAKAMELVALVILSYVESQVLAEIQRATQQSPENPIAIMFWVALGIVGIISGVLLIIRTIKDC